MDKTTSALKLAEKALYAEFYDDIKQIKLAEALAAVREALAEQEKQEPVGMVEFTNEQYLELSKIVDITIAHEYCHLNGEELKNAWLIEYGKSVYARAWLDGHDCAMNENEERQWVDLTDDEIDLIEQQVYCRTTQKGRPLGVYAVELVRAVIAAFKEKNK